MNKIISTICVLFSGYAYSQVPHFDDSNVVGAIVSGGSAACFDDDGSVTSDLECDMYIVGVSEGYVRLSLSGWSGEVDFVSIGGCGTSAVNPVSSASCPLTTTTSFAACTNNGYVLVQTALSGHFFALKANENCTQIATPETAGIVPCLTTDSFDPLTGCTRQPPQHGYLNIDTTEGSAPTNIDCATPSHMGRMVVDDVNDLLYICTQSGWISK